MRRGWDGLPGAFVQYVDPSASTSRPSRGKPTRGQDRSRTMTTGTQRRRRSGSGAGGPETEAPGYTARTPDSLLRGPVSTALTSTSPPPKLSTGIVGILRFLFEVRRRCRADVSAMDTNAPSCLFPQHTIRSRTTSPPRAPARASASAVLILIRLRSEETVQRVKGTNARPTRRTRGGIGLRLGRRFRICARWP